MGILAGANHGQYSKIFCGLAEIAFHEAGVGITVQLDVHVLQLSPESGRQRD